MNTTNDNDNEKETVPISRDALLQELARDIIGRAVADLGDQDPVKAADAFYWLTSEDFPWWAEAWGHSFADPYQMILSGGAQKYIRNKRRSHV